MSPSQGILTPSVPHGYGHPHPRGSDPQHPPGTVMSLSQVTPHRHAGLGVSRQVPVLVRGEGTGHGGESQSKGMRRKKGARPGRKETLPGHFPGTAANTEGCLAADTSTGGWRPLGSPGAPSDPPGHPTGREKSGAGGRAKQHGWMTPEQMPYGKKEEEEDEGTWQGSIAPELRGPGDELPDLGALCAA